MTDYQNDNNTKTRAVCAQCGLPYERTSSRQRICPECYRANQNKAKARWAKNKRRKLKENEQARPPEPKSKPVPKGVKEDPNRHVCTWFNSCEYGTPQGEDFRCNYFTANEGKLRTEGGLHQIRDGRCDLYKRRARNRSGWQRERDEKLEKEATKNAID